MLNIAYLGPFNTGKAINTFVFHFINHHAFTFFFHIKTAHSFGWSFFAVVFKKSTVQIQIQSTFKL